MEVTQLITLVGGGIASLVLGAVQKKVPQIPNGLIPLVNGAVLSLLFATIGGLGFTYSAVIAGMTAAYVGTAAYELKNVAKPATNGGGTGN